MGSVIMLRYLTFRHYVLKREAAEARAAGREPSPYAIHRALRASLAGPSRPAWRALLHRA